MREEIPAGLAGLLISYALSVPETLSWLVKMTASLETSAVAIERISEYLEVVSVLFVFFVEGDY